MWKQIEEKMKEGKKIVLLVSLTYLFIIIIIFLLITCNGWFLFRGKIGLISSVLTVN